MKVSLSERIRVKALKELSKICESNPHVYSAAGIGKKVGIGRRTACEILLIYDRRPDLLKEVFADRLSIYAAGRMMRSKPSIEKPKARTRI